MRSVGGDADDDDGRAKTLGAIDDLRMKADGTYPAPVPHTLRQRVPKAQGFRKFAVFFLSAFVYGVWVSGLEGRGLGLDGWILQLVY